MAEEFTHRFVPALQKRVHRLGLAANFGIDERGASAAFERGLNYVFWSPFHKELTRALVPRLRRDRETVAVVAGPLTGWLGGSVRRGAEKALKTLGVDYLDVFQLYWVGVTSALTSSTLRELEQLKKEGKVRALGVSIHDRKRAARLAAESPLDLLMIRYNAAHPGAERDVFPALEKRRPAVVAYTATSWRKLLKPPRGWSDRPATAGECYRFCLSSPHVDVTLCGPADERELDEDLKALEKGPLSAEEMAWMRRLGEAVHG